jgi:hypothetical protein
VKRQGGNREKQGRDREKQGKAGKRQGKTGNTREETGTETGTVTGTETGAKFRYNRILKDRIRTASSPINNQLRFIRLRVDSAEFPSDFYRTQRIRYRIL